jgi:Tol biopolymer transport system component
MLSFGALFAITIGAGPSHSAPALPNPPAPSIKERFPHLTGVLLFHRYTSYNAWDSTLWILDLPTGRLAQLSQNWGVIHPMNGHFSQDGRRIVFMGSQKGVHDWDVFLSTFDGQRWAEPTNLTGLNGKRDEDPKFAPDGKSIIYKSDGILTQIDLTGKTLATYSTGEGEASMPFFTPDGNDILFENSRTIKMLSHGVIRNIWGGNGKHAYYPIAINSESLYFTQTQDSRCDRVMLSDYFGRAKPLFFDSPLWDSSDPYPYQDGNRYLFFVSTNRQTGFGGYDLAFADLTKKKVWNLFTLNHKTNTFMEELGPSWSLNAPYPAKV